MTGWLVFAGVVGFYTLMAWGCIRADARDEAAYQRWYTSPNRVWNQNSRGRRLR